jgi:hypothetical protein
MEKYKKDINRYAIFLFFDDDWIHIDDGDNKINFSTFIEKCIEYDVEEHVIAKYKIEKLKSFFIETNIILN